MNSPSARNSPQYKNINSKHKQSPKELKDKMRKTYKDKVQNCRELLMDRFRGSVEKEDLSKTLTDIYKSMFDENGTFENEVEVLEELKEELVQEELEWWVKEYEKSQLDNVDWSSVEQDDRVICPICKKCNLKHEPGHVSCLFCKFKCNTTKSLLEMKKSLTMSLEKHAETCTHDPQFTVIPDANDSHIYLICESCAEMNAVM